MFHFVFNCRTVWLTSNISGKLWSRFRCEGAEETILLKKISLRSDDKSYERDHYLQVVGPPGVWRLVVCFDFWRLHMFVEKWAGGFCWNDAGTMLSKQFVWWNVMETLWFISHQKRPKPPAKKSVYACCRWNGSFCGFLLSVCKSWF